MSFIGAHLLEPAADLAENMDDRLLEVCDTEMVGEAVEARYQIRRYLHRHEERRWPVSAAERRSLSHLGGRSEKVPGHGMERWS